MKISTIVLAIASLAIASPIAEPAPEAAEGDVAARAGYSTYGDYKGAGAGGKYSSYGDYKGAGAGGKYSSYGDYKGAGAGGKYSSYGDYKGAGANLPSYSNYGSYKKDLGED